MKQFLWGSVAGKVYTVGTLILVGVLAGLIPIATNEYPLFINIIIGCLFLGFWLVLGAILVTMYNLAKDKR